MDVTAWPRKKRPWPAALLWAEHYKSSLWASEDRGLMLKVKQHRFAPHKGIRMLVASFQQGETASFPALPWFLGLRHHRYLHMEADVALWSQDTE